MANLSWGKYALAVEESRVAAMKSICWVDERVNLFILRQRSNEWNRDGTSWLLSVPQEMSGLLGANCKEKQLFPLGKDGLWWLRGLL